ncbi:WD40 repeat-like protein [Melanomma pulvis-pyrius CBS 109.77]|uniref:WD40 repeat-like protein n=1 Tax=Melanomma pulvis-pyrius CBS 109.77 TaxID=1314802 RepID=A0A6A6XVN5_9PLEO|nr:WD40 repeat-like protein [Melanomma pulvis-pyrius CBS 109.77]
MPPKTRTANRSNDHKRFEPPKVQNVKISNSDDERDAVAGAVRLATKQQAEPEWEGFGEDAEDEINDEGVGAGDEESEDEEDEDEDITMDTEDDIPEKDESEEELERLVFGDSAGFKEGIKAFSLNPLAAALGESSEDEKDEEEDLENIADQDLFFFDSGPTAAPAGSLVPVKDEEEEQGDKPAWEDSDDDKLVVSLASVPQLRKLREDEEDDMVNGEEYVRRLRKQYQRLYPTPEWALHATGKTKRKRTRTMGDGESGDESASDMDVDEEEDLSTQPLARLMKDADILSRNTSRSPAKRRKLQAGTIDIQRLKDVSKNGPSAVTSLSFHPAYPLILSSGPSSTLYLHHINPNPPNPNPLLTSLHIKKTPLTTTAFHPSTSDSRIFLSARRRYFHIWNVATGSVEKISRVYGHQHEQRSMEYFSLSPNGKYMALQGSSRKGGGVINVLDATTLQWVTQARIESRGGVADFAWWGNGQGLAIAGKNGEVTEWSVKDGVIGRWNDEGAVGTTVIALGGKSGRGDWIGGDRWVAMGSSSGVVNLYDRRAWSENTETPSTEDTNNGIPKAPKPLRAFDNLTTPTSHLAFSPDGQILCMASRWKHNAVRLVHLPSATVFRNWPTTKTPLGRVSSIAWGRPTEAEEKEGCLALLAAGNEAGRVRLWEVRA